MAVRYYRWPEASGFRGLRSQEAVLPEVVVCILIYYVRIMALA